MSARNKSKRVVPVNHNQLKNMWKSNINEYTAEDQTTPKKNIRIFNKSGLKSRGKIVIDDQTWVDYDYSTQDSGTKLRHKNDDDIPRDIFALPKYPVLRGIKNDLPDTHSEHLKDMDLYLIKDIKEAVLWKDKELEFYS